jgi:ubiquinone/menaquinone biosynthesis C-methylase UbiE
MLGSAQPYQRKPDFGSTRRQAVHLICSAPTIFGYSQTIAARMRLWLSRRRQVSEHQFRFDDGAAYERMMGTWSRLVGDVFLDWLSPRPELRWIDVGCGNGAFTERLIERCAPAGVVGIDPSEAQLAFARSRCNPLLAQFHQGSATALPFPEDSFDAAVMALVIFFVPDPTKAVAKMVQVVGSGGIVAAYAWDMLKGGSPTDPLWEELRMMGIEQTFPPSPDASSIEVLQDLWINAGLEAVETREITVSRTFPDFDDFWMTTRSAAPALSAAVARVTDAERLRIQVQQRLSADADGRVTYTARANAVKGRVPT